MMMIITKRNRKLRKLIIMYVVDDKQWKGDLDGGSIRPLPATDNDIIPVLYPHARPLHPLLLPP